MPRPEGLYKNDRTSEHVISCLFYSQCIWESKRALEIKNSHGRLIMHRHVHAH